MTAGEIFVAFCSVILIAYIAWNVWSDAVEKRYRREVQARLQRENKEFNERVRADILAEVRKSLPGKDGTP